MPAVASHSHFVAVCGSTPKLLKRSFVLKSVTCNAVLGSFLRCAVLPYMRCCCSVRTVLTLSCSCHVAGAKLLLLYQKHDFNSPLSVGQCNRFIEYCMQQIKAGNAHEDYHEAVLTLLPSMLDANLPHPTVSTYKLATECLLASNGGGGGLPAHQLIVQLQQCIWGPMHETLGAAADTAHAYVPAFDCLGATEVIQMVLLMAQNGLPGLDSNCCLALALTTDDYHQDWMQQHFGAGFMEEVQAAADSMDYSRRVLFPSCQLPRLFIPQLDYGTQYFVLEGGIQMPWWMVPVGEAQGAHTGQGAAAKGTPQEPAEASLDAAEQGHARQLVQQWGHLDKNSSRKGRR